jgi:hypothetical protein
MQLELSQAQYDAWRDRAIDGLASGNLYTDEQIATLRAGPDEHFEFPGLAPAVGNHLIDALLYNKRVDDFMIDGRLRHAGSYTLSLDMLSMYGEDPERGPLPATVHFYDDAR